MATMVSTWRTDSCYNPSHREAYAKDSTGQVWHLHRPMAGYAICARPLPYNKVNAGRLRMINDIAQLED